MVVENSVEEENCQCGKPYKDKNFKCNICRKYFCNRCPTGPVDNNCLECLLSESRPITSTPIKKITDLGCDLNSCTGTLNL